jgi:hypothetical protein
MASDGIATPAFSRSGEPLPVADPALHFAERRVFLLLAIDRTARFTQVVIGGPQPL